jgi:hypothetical protein
MNVNAIANISRKINVAISSKINNIRTTKMVKRNKLFKGV